MPGRPTRVSYRPIWEAATQLGLELRRSPHVAAVSEAFDHDVGHDDVSPHITVVRNILAGLGMLSSRPLLLGLYLPQLPTIPPIPGYEELMRTQGGAGFAESAAKAAAALLSVIEFARSRLPGYPSLQVPDLSPGSPRVVDDGLMEGGRYPWPAVARAQGFENSGPPALSGLEIEVGPLQGVLSELIDALAESDPWQSFSGAGGEMQQGDRDELTNLIADFESRTQRELVDAEAGALLIRRGQYARSVLEDIHASARGRAAEYLAAFRRVDALIDRAAAIVSEQAVYSARYVVSEDAQVTWHREDDAFAVRAQISEFGFLTPGRVVIYPGAPPVAGAWLTTGTHTNFNMELGVEVTLTAIALPDSEGVFEDPPAKS